MSSTPIQRTQVERNIGGKVVSIETGHLAKQAHGSVVVRIGDTMTLVAVVAAPGREGLDFFPLTVDYREKTYAAGKFPGGYIKRDDGSSAHLPLYIKRDGESEALYIREAQTSSPDSVSFVPCARAFCAGGYIE